MSVSFIRVKTYMTLAGVPSPINFSAKRAMGSRLRHLNRKYSIGMSKSTNHSSLDTFTRTLCCDPEGDATFVLST